MVGCRSSCEDGDHGGSWWWVADLHVRMGTTVVPMVGCRSSCEDGDHGGSWWWVADLPVTMGVAGGGQTVKTWLT